MLTFLGNIYSQLNGYGGIVDAGMTGSGYVLLPAFVIVFLIAVIVGIIVLVQKEQDL